VNVGLSSHPGQLIKMVEYARKRFIGVCEQVVSGGSHPLTDLQCQIIREAMHSLEIEARREERNHCAEILEKQAKRISNSVAQTSLMRAAKDLRQ